jgi:uncharacterized membrane protein YfcA
VHLFGFTFPADDVIGVVAGLVVGLTIGLTGVGGGAFLTPFLIAVLRVHPAVAVSTSLLFTLVTRTAGSFQHLRQGTVDMSVVRRMAIGSVPAAIVASTILLLFAHGHAADPIRDRLIQLCLLIAAAVLTYRIVRPPKQGENDRHPISLTVLGAIVGVMVAVSSVGSGSVAVSGLVALTTLAIPRVVGSDMVHAVILAAVAAPLAIIQTTPDFVLVLFLVIGSIPGVIVGSRLSALVPQRITKVTVAITVWTLALKVA